LEGRDRIALSKALVAMLVRIRGLTLIPGFEDAAIAED
jgi:hypothetical protein